MSIAERFRELFAAVEHLATWKLLALVAVVAGLSLLWALLRQQSNARQLKRALEAAKQEAIEGRGVELDESAVLQGTALAPIDRFLPRDPRRFLAIVVGVAVGCWVAGLLLAPNVRRFVASPEWLFQPLYIAAHFITLRMFINVYTRNFSAGVAHLDVHFATAMSGVRVVLGPLGVLAAILIAIPFCVADYRYLYTDRYVRMGQGDQVLAIDLLMWSIWSLEWFINALTWVLLIGFLINNIWTIRSYAFKSPIDVVLQDRHYRPFLQMSSQGASIVLGFSVCTVIYLVLTGGELTDYLGLVITGVLLVIGFLPPWVLLNAKVTEAVNSQIAGLRRQLVEVGGSSAAVSATSGVAQPLDKRLDEVVTILRLTHLEGLYRTLGKTEATAILVRLLAPALTIGWQVAQNSSSYMLKLQQVFTILVGR